MDIELNYCSCDFVIFFHIIKDHKLLNYVLKNSKCALMYHLTCDEIAFLKKTLLK